MTVRGGRAAGARVPRGHGRDGRAVPPVLRAGRSRCPFCTWIPRGRWRRGLRPALAPSHSIRDVPPQRTWPRRPLGSPELSPNSRAGFLLPVRPPQAAGERGDCPTGRGRASGPQKLRDAGLLPRGGPGGARSGPGRPRPSLPFRSPGPSARAVAATTRAPAPWPHRPARHGCSQDKSPFALILW